MPLGLLIMQWNYRTGGEIVAKYPEDVELEDRAKMQIFSQHEYSGDASFITLSTATINLISYFTGNRDNGAYIILILDFSEDGYDYEGGILSISRQVVDNLENRKVFEDLIPAFFKRITTYKTFTEEQKLGLLLTDEIKREVINNFRTEPAIFRDDLLLWLKDKYAISDEYILDETFRDLIKYGIATTTTIEGMTADILFFLNDIMMLRIPPEDLLKDPSGHNLPKSLTDDYLHEIKIFFENYKISQEDSLRVVENCILDADTYEVLKLLRTAIVTRNDLEKMRGRKIDDVDVVLKKLWDQKMISVLQDASGNEYFALVSDFVIKKFYPTYNLDTIVQLYKNKAAQPKVLLKALDLMKEEFYKQEKGDKPEKRDVEEITETA